MATTARTRRPASASADKPEPAVKTPAKPITKPVVKPAAKKKAADKAAPAQAAGTRPAAAKKAAVTPAPQPAVKPAAKPAAAPVAKKAAAKKKSAVKAPVQQELVLEVPGTSARTRKTAAAKTQPASKPPVASPAAKRTRGDAAAQPAPVVAAPVAEPAAKKSASKTGKTAVKTAGKGAPAKPVQDQAVAEKPQPSPKAPAKKSAGKPAAKKAPAKTAAGKKAADTRRGKPGATEPSAQAAKPQTHVAAEAPTAPAPDLLSALAQQADEAPVNAPELPQPTPAAAFDALLEHATQAALEAANTPAEPGPSTPAAAPAVAAASHSSVQLVEHQQQRHLQWQAGRDCPQALHEAARGRVDDQGRLNPSDDTALPTLLRLAAEAGHRLDIDPAVWQQLAADRDARHRLHRLEAAYASGPSSPALQGLLQTTLPTYQAEGALFAVVAGRALIADERGLGKRVQAIAAASLWRRHFGVQRVLVLCTPSQRAAWQHSWLRLAGGTLNVPPQVIEGAMHQRQALWSSAAEVRILAPEALDTDAAHIADWAPELVIVDEPQQLSGWQALQAPHALVLCGAPLIEAPALLQAIVEWLDVHRQGALQAVLRIRQARDEGLSLANDELERLDNSLSRLMLQRQRSEVQDQLPPCVHSERLVPLAPPQRDAHERLRTLVQRLLAGWQRCGYLSDADQWQLSAALRELPEACHRSQPGDARSGLAEASIAALQAQLDDWAATGTARVAVVCASAADQAQLAERLRFSGSLQWLAAGDAPAQGTEVVLQVGVPWRAPKPNGHDSEAGVPPAQQVQPGQQWVYLAAQGSLEQGLMDTLLWRQHTACGPAEASSTGFLHGQPLADWLQAWSRALQATPAAV